MQSTGLHVDINITRIFFSVLWPQRMSRADTKLTLEYRTACSYLYAVKRKTKKTPKLPADFLNIPVKD